MQNIIELPIGTLKPSPHNARTHSKRQIRQIANSIQEFGFVVPLVVDDDFTVIMGHGRLQAAEHLGLLQVPVIQVHGLSAAKKRALAIADNKIASNAGWDREKLALEIAELDKLLEVELLDISLTGFDPAEIDQLAVDFEHTTSASNEEYDTSLERQTAVSRAGDIWTLGAHRLMCGNARDANHIDLLMEGDMASMGFSDPPYNVRVSSIVGRGRTKHREFAEGSGEMTREDFVAFLRITLGNAARVSLDGAVHYICMDWRHVDELMAAGSEIYNAHLNTAVWCKSSAGQGSFYRSQHELILIYRAGSANHLNNIQLGKHGRSRSNVWNYPSVNTFKTGRLDDLKVHPTVKPINLVVDAIRDCTRRGDVVLDIFAGSGTTILAAERIGRRARTIEIDPVFVDVAIRRWQLATGKDATRVSDQAVFSDLEHSRQD